jgi:hypothetical protein
MKKMIITAFMLSLVSVSAIASVLDPSENRYIRSLAAKNMEVLVSTEREISRLSHNDRELVLFTASAYLNQKFSNLV